MCRSLLLLLGLLWHFHTFGQSGASDSLAKAEVDPYLKESIQNDRYFSKEDWEKAKNGINYRDEEKVLSKQAPEIEPPKVWSLGTLKYVLYLVIGGIIIAFLVWLAQQINNTPRIPKLTSTVVESGENLSKEELMLLDLEAMIPQAIQNKDYYLATRLLYLKALQLLVLKGIIEWRKDQTNRTILGQLPLQEMQQSTKTVFSQYEIVWYGQKNMLESEFQSFLGKCEALFSTLHQTSGK